MKRQSVLSWRRTSLGLSHAAANLFAGSEVLGFDTPRSMDHWWGPRVTLFVRTEAFSTELAEDIRRVMGEELPFEMGPSPGPDLPHAWQGQSPEELLGEARQRHANHNGLKGLKRATH
ncbi:MAG TPA: hypothetical protein VFG86_27455 [Chloroflexota bacterium]|jgi:hypothetical protein|nr:hypothetical protein [Chloroflexota bacterium]